MDLDGHKWRLGDLRLSDWGLGAGDSFYGVFLAGNMGGVEVEMRKIIFRAWSKIRKLFTKHRLNKELKNLEHPVKIEYNNQTFLVFGLMYIYDKENESWERFC